MRGRITRRELYRRVGGALAAAPLLQSGGCSGTLPPKPRAQAAAGEVHSQLRVTRGKPDLVVPHDTPSGDTWRYGLCSRSSSRPCALPPSPTSAASAGTISRSAPV